MGLYRKAILFAVSAIVVGCCGFMYCHIDEDLHFKRRSLEYMLFIDSDLVRAFPIGEGTASYSYSGGDGNKPPYNAVEISSRHFPSKAYNFLRSNLALMSCEKQLSPASEASDFHLTTESLCAECRTSNTAVSIIMRQDSAGMYFLSLTEYRTDQLTPSEL